MCLSGTEKGSQTHMRLNNPSLDWVPQWRDGTGILKTVSERRSLEGVSDAHAAE